MALQIPGEVLLDRQDHELNNIEFGSETFPLSDLKVGEMPMLEGSIVAVKYLKPIPGGSTYMKLPLIRQGRRWDVYSGSLDSRAKSKEMAVKPQDVYSLVSLTGDWGDNWLPVSFEVFSQESSNPADNKASSLNSSWPGISSKAVAPTYVSPC